MSFLILLIVGLVVGATTVLFGFGGGFVTVPIIAVVDAALGGDAIRVATATSALVMLVNAVVATLAAPRETLRALSGHRALFVLLAAGGAAGALVSGIAPGMLVRWGFVLYIAATIVDLLVRPGFLRPAIGIDARTGSAVMAGLPAWLGLPIGSLAAFLGVGGSVMTVPLLRRAGASMSVAATLANPLTLAIVGPALIVSFLAGGGEVLSGGIVGVVDVASATALLIGSIPVVVLLRRNPPRIPDRAHAWTYLGLLVVAAATVAATG